MKPRIRKSFNNRGYDIANNMSIIQNLESLALIIDIWWITYILLVNNVSYDSWNLGKKLESVVDTNEKSEAYQEYFGNSKYCKFGFVDHLD